MLLRAAFAFGVALILMPHQPDLGLPDVPKGVIGQYIERAETLLKDRLAIARQDIEAARRERSHKLR